MVKPAVCIQELKNKLTILGHELKVTKKINDSLYRNTIINIRLQEISIT